MEELYWLAELEHFLDLEVIHMQAEEQFGHSVAELQMEIYHLPHLLDLLEQESLWLEPTEVHISEHGQVGTNGN